MCRWAPDTETKIPTEPVPVGVAYWPRGCIACRAGQPRTHNLGTLKVEGNLLCPFRELASSGPSWDSSLKLRLNEMMVRMPIWCPLRAVLIVPPDEADETCLFLIPSKMNIAPMRYGLAYRIEGCRR